MTCCSRLQCSSPDPSRFLHRYSFRPPVTAVSGDVLDAHRLRNEMPHGLKKAQEPRILFLDAYDSFSNNIVALIKQHIAAEVCVLRIDDPRYLCPGNDDAFLSLLRTFDAVVAGPGPGSPRKPADVGLMARLWTLKDRDILPVLGICLGFQSLALAYGAAVERLTEPCHGVVKRVEHNGQSIFAGVGAVHVTLYNSLRAELGHSRNLTDDVEAEASREEGLWRETAACPSLIPLAWIRGDADNGDILMAVRHTTKPLLGRPVSSGIDLHQRGRSERRDELVGGGLAVVVEPEGPSKTERQFPWCSWWRNSECGLITAKSFASRPCGRR